MDMGQGTGQVSFPDLHSLPRVAMDLKGKHINKQFKARKKGSSPDPDL